MESMLNAWAPQQNGIITVLQLNYPPKIFAAASHTYTNRSNRQQTEGFTANINVHVGANS